MANNRTCPECERALPEGAMESVCPVCSLKSALSIDAGLLAVKVKAAEPAANPISFSPREFRGQDFGDYALLELIGRGGMGVVYKARQRSLDRIVALKLLLFGPQASSEYVKRFRAEAVAAASLQHPNIVAIHEVGVHQDQPFYVMDYVAGQNLALLAGNQPMSARHAAGYLKTIAGAIHYAHQRGLLHRDLKPSNVLIDENDQPRVTDFGLAKRFESDSQVTLTGQVLGSPSYIPPEQALGKRAKISRQSDVYGLGAMLYHLLTGRPPFQGESVTDTLQQVHNAEPVAPRYLNPNVPRDLETICLKCLEKEPHRRYPTAQALAEDLERYLGDRPVLARPLGPPGKAWRWCRRRPPLAGLSIALVLTFVLGLAGVLMQWRRAEGARVIAETNVIHALRLAYAGDMNLVQRDLEYGNLSYARELLDNYRPSAGSIIKTDMRGWEWRYLWGLSHNDSLVPLNEFTSPASGLAFSGDGQKLAILREGRSVEIWDWPKRQKKCEFSGPGKPSHMALSETGNTLATVHVDTNDNTSIVLYDLNTSKTITTFPHNKIIISIAMAPDGKLLVAVDIKAEVNFWELPSGILVTNFPVIENATLVDNHVLQFSPDGQILAMGNAADDFMSSRKGAIRLFDNRGTHLNDLLALPGASSGISAIAFSPDGRTLAAAYEGSEAVIRLWDFPSGSLVGQLNGQKGRAKRLVFSKDGRTLYSGGDDQTILIWDLEKKRIIERLLGHTWCILDMAICPDGKSILSCALKGSVRLWDFNHKKQRKPHLTLPMQVGAFSAPFTADSRHLITASKTNDVIIWDVSTGEEFDRIPELGTNNQAVAISPDGKSIVVGSTDGFIKAWDLEKKQMVANFKAHEHPVFGLEFFDNGKSLISIGMAPHLEILLERWDTVTWKKKPFLDLLTNMFFGMAQSPDHRQLAVAYANGPVKLYDYVSGRLETILSPTIRSSFQPVYSRNGLMLAASGDLLGYIWEMPTGRVLARLGGQYHGLVMAMAFTPDGSRVATGGMQPVVRIWDYTVQRELVGLSVEGNLTIATKFSPDGNTLLALSWLGIADLWHAPSWEEIEAMQKEPKMP